MAQLARRRIFHFNARGLELECFSARQTRTMQQVTHDAHINAHARVEWYNIRLSSRLYDLKSTASLALH